MPWPLIHVLPKRLRVLCRELTGNLLGMDERNFPQHNGNLISEGVTVAIPVLQHFTASTDFVIIITVRQKTKISHSQCNTFPSGIGQQYFNLVHVHFFFHMQPVIFKSQTLFTLHFHPTALFINNCTQTQDTKTCIQTSLWSGISLINPLEKLLQAVRWNQFLAATKDDHTSALKSSNTTQNSCFNHTAVQVSTITMIQYVKLFLFERADQRPTPRKQDQRSPMHVCLQKKWHLR